MKTGNRSAGVAPTRESIVANLLEVVEVSLGRAPTRVTRTLNGKAIIVNVYKRDLGAAIKALEALMIEVERRELAGERAVTSGQFGSRESAEERAQQIEEMLKPFKTFHLEP